MRHRGSLGGAQGSHHPLAKLEHRARDDHIQDNARRHPASVLAHHRVQVDIRHTEHRQGGYPIRLLHVGAHRVGFLRQGHHMLGQDREPSQVGPDPLLHRLQGISHRDFILLSFFLSFLNPPFLLNCKKYILSLYF